MKTFEHSMNILLSCAKLGALGLWDSGTPGLCDSGTQILNLIKSRINILEQNK